VSDPGLDSTEPTDEQLAAEDQARSARSVRDLIDEDLADRRTPSRRFLLEPEVGGEHLEGFDVDLREWEPPHGR
jgi:hypothetical protein